MGGEGAERARRAREVAEQVAGWLDKACPRVAPELGSELRPVVEALLEAREGGGAKRPREALALASLLGRRAALVGLRPGLLARVPAALGAAFRARDRPLDDDLLDDLVEVTLEGFCGALEEQGATRRDRALARTVGFTPLGVGVVLLPLRGALEPAALCARLETLGPELHRRDVRACVIDARGLDGDPPARPVLAPLVRAAELLGIPLFLTGLPPPWREALPEGAAVERCPDVPTAVRAAFAACGHALRRPSALQRLVRRRR